MQAVGHYIPSVDHSAVCVDGSPPMYWFRKGKDNQVSKWMIVFEDGILCDEMLGFQQQSFMNKRKYCNQLVNSYFGTSNPLLVPVRIDLNSSTSTFLDSKKHVSNVVREEWNIVVMHSCDASYWAASLPDFYTINNSKYYFQGGRIVKAILDDLMRNFQLNAATEVIISGQGLIGGFAALNYVDQISETLRTEDPFKIVGLVGDAYLPMSETVSTEWRPTFEKLSMVDSVNKNCVHNDLEGFGSNCLNSLILLTHVVSPVFSIQMSSDRTVSQLEEDCTRSGFNSEKNFGVLTDAHEVGSPYVPIMLQDWFSLHPLVQGSIESGDTISESFDNWYMNRTGNEQDTIGDNYVDSGSESMNFEGLIEQHRDLNVIYYYFNITNSTYHTPGILSRGQVGLIGTLPSLLIMAIFTIYKICHKHTHIV